MSLATIPRQVSIDPDGTPRVGAQWYFFIAGTATAVPTYTTPEMDVEHPIPVESDGNGYFPEVHIDAEAYPLTKQVMLDADGLTIFTEDNIATAGFTASDVGAVLYPISPAEQAAGITEDDIEIERQYGDVRRYGAVDDNSTDSLEAFNLAREAHRNGGPPILIVENGAGFRLSDVFTLDFNAARVETIGRPLIRSTNVSDDVIFFDGGASGRLEDCHLGKCLLDGGNNGLRLRSVHRSRFTARCRNHVNAALKTEFAVGDIFEITCSFNVDTFTTTPAYGLHLYRRGAGEGTVDNVFLNPVLEGTVIGTYCEDAQCNVFVGGNSEGCSSGATGGGVLIAAGSDDNLFLGHFCEVNGTTATNYDFKISGSRNRLINCSAISGSSNKGIWVADGRGNHVQGGTFRFANVDASAVRTVFERALRMTGGTLTDAGSQTTTIAIDGGGVGIDTEKFGFLSPSLPSFTGTWANYGSGQKSVGYFKDPFGMVHLEGSCYNGTVGTAIFTLAAGFRPASKQTFLCAGANSTDVVRVEIDSSGVLTHIDGVNTRVSLDGIHFLAA